jgi:NADPH-dependent 2,4-dienoyl-CoA reductase/sulfur reductase-like enzyme
MRECDVCVIGAGAAGLPAAAAALERGRKVALVERDAMPGGILNQCIHNGFGLTRHKVELTGPEYAAREYARLGDGAAGELEEYYGTFVYDIRREADGSFTLSCAGGNAGLFEIRAKAVVSACGCRERSRGEINIAGTRPAGVYTAGAAQRLVNVEGAMVGRRVVILGSGDIGLIMARRMTWEGAEVVCVLELADTPGGLRRNIVQCLEDNDIPLRLSTTVTEIRGRDRLESVVVQAVDPATFKPVPGTEEVIACDTLLLSVGLIPDIAILKDLGCELDARTKGPKVDSHLMTTVPGVFAVGNQLHVHDLADFASEEGRLAGAFASDWIDEPSVPECEVSVSCGAGVGSVTPQALDSEDGSCTFYLRSNRRFENATIRAVQDGRIVKKKRARIVVPSEMQRIAFGRDDIDGGGPVVVEIVGD